MIKNYKEIEVNRLVKADWNYKQDDDEKKEKLKANIQRNGQIENIIVRPLGNGRYEVVNGNHRYDALVELGFDTVVCYDLGPTSKAAAIRIAIETNETKFSVDNIILAERISELAEEFTISDLALTMPYSEVDIENYKKLLDFDWSKFDKENLEIEVKDGKFSVSIVSDSPDKINAMLEQMGLEKKLGAGQSKIEIEV